MRALNGHVWFKVLFYFWGRWAGVGEETRGSSHTETNPTPIRQPSSKACAHGEVVVALLYARKSARYTIVIARVYCAQSLL